MIKNLFLINDASSPWQLSFQDPATSIMENIIQLHNDIMFYIVLIVILVFWLLARVLILFTNNKKAVNVTHGSLLEFLWTLAPTLILIVISIPSLKLLYAMDEVVNPSITIKAIGHQWYWSYEYSDYNTEEPIAFDSCLVPTDELEKGDFRLLEVDNRVVLPINTHIRVIITSADVLHAWAVPSFGVKMDACPGRLNQVGVFIKREGLYYGQCSELCGVNHGYMPIVVEAVSMDDYISWISNLIEEG